MPASVCVQLLNAIPVFRHEYMCASECIDAAMTTRICSVAVLTVAQPLCTKCMCVCVQTNELKKQNRIFLFSLIRNTNERVAGTHMPQHWCVYNNNNNNNSNAISSDDANKTRIQFFVDHVPRTGVKSSKIRESKGWGGGWYGKGEKSKTKLYNEMVFKCVHFDRSLRNEQTATVPLLCAPI